VDPIAVASSAARDTAFALPRGRCDGRQAIDATRAAFRLKARTAATDRLGSTEIPLREAAVPLMHW
jgi:hypothetical protein